MATILIKKIYNKKKLKLDKIKGQSKIRQKKAIKFFIKNLWLCLVTFFIFQQLFLQNFFIK